MKLAASVAAACAMTVLAVGAAAVLAPPERAEAATAKPKAKAKAPARRPAARPAPRPAPPPLPSTAQLGPGEGPIAARYAALYVEYLNDVNAVAERPIASRADIDAVIAQISRHPGERLAKGWIAYGAYAASQEDAFVDDVRKLASYYGTDVMVRGLRSDIGYARGMRGGPAALTRALSASADDSARIRAVADRYKQLSYAVQLSPWSQERVAAAEARSRTAAVRTLALTPRAPAPALVAQIGRPAGGPAPRAWSEGFWSTVAWAQPAQRLAPIPGAAPEARNSTADRMTALAGLMALDADAAQPESTQMLLASRNAGNCFEAVRLNMNQCVAAAGRRYEHVFCVAEHPLGETAQCMARIGTP